MDSKRRFPMLASCLLLLFTLLGAAAPSTAVTAATPDKTTYTNSTDVMCEVPVPMQAPMSAFNAVAAEPRPVGDGPSYFQAARIWAAGWIGKYAGPQDSRPIQEEKTFIMRYDGTKWGVMATPNMPGANFLNAIAVRSATDAWAVGYYTNHGIDHPLALHFDGREWKLALYPEPALAANSVSARYTGITLVDTPVLRGNVIVAVGYKQFLLMPRPPEPMAMIYDGQSWSNFPVPTLPLDSRLNSITGNSLDDLWATASSYTNGGADTQSTLWHFDGTKWKLASQVQGTLSGVALTTNKVFAVGTQPFGLKTQTLAIMYDRASQETLRLKTGDKPVNLNYFTQVTSEGQEVYAVGFAGDANSEYSLTPVVQRFDGFSFSPVQMTNPNLTGKLSGAVYHNGNLWAVGDHKMDRDLRAPLALTTLCTTGSN